MRWVYFLILVLLGTVLQTTLVQVLWFRTAVGWIGPELPAATAVFVALYVRTGADAALAGWTLGMAVDLTAGGAGMGMLSLLYMVAAAGVFRLREAFFRDRLSTQLILAAAFCLFVYGFWTGYETLRGLMARVEFWRRALQVAALAVYTALLTVPVCAAMKRVQRFLFAAPPGRGRR